MVPGWVFLALSLIAARAARAGDWTFYRHDLSGTANAGEALTVDQARALEVHRFTLGGGVNVSNPIVANGSLYFMGGNFLHAVDLSTYTERWRTNMSVHAPFPPCVNITAQSPIGAPAVIGSTVFAPGADGIVYALDARTGAQIWATPIADVHNLGDFLWSSIFPVDNKIYIGVASIIDCTLVPGRLVQLDQATGAVTGTWWADAQHRDGGGIWTQQAYDPVTNRLFATTGTIGKGFTTAEQPWADAFVAIDATTMQTVDWLSPIPLDTFSADVDFGASPTLYDSPDGRHFIAAADKNGLVYAADRDHLSNGVAWSYRISGSGASPDQGESTIVSAPYADGMLYVAGARTADNKFPGAIAGLDAFTGAEIWLFHPDGFVLAGMTVTGDVLFASTTDPASFRGKLYALDRHTGEVLYQFAAAGMFGEPTWANGALYVPDSSGGMYELVPNPLGPQPDFDLELDGLFGSVVAGGTATFAATVIPKNGFNGTVTLSATKLLPRSTAKFTPATLGPGSYTSQLAISAAPDSGLQDDLSVISAAGGGKTRSAGIWMVTTDFALSGTAAQVLQGSSADSTLTISGQNGFAEPVTLTASGLPGGTSLSFSANPATTQSRLTFATSAATPPGAYPVQVIGTTSSGATRQCTVSLVVTQAADFKLQLKNPSLDVAAGGNVVYELTIAATTGFAGPFTFTVDGLPPGATASFAAGQTAGVEELTISIAPKTPAGAFSISISAGGGGLTRTASALLTVVPGDFDLTAASAATVAQGGVASLSVQISPRGGFTDAIALDVQGLPSGVTGTLAPLDASHASTLTLHASRDAAPGTYPAQIVASGGGITRTVPLSIEVVGASSGGCSTRGPTGLGPALVALLALAAQRRRARSGRASAR